MHPHFYGMIHGMVSYVSSGSFGAGMFSLSMSGIFLLLMSVIAEILAIYLACRILEIDASLTSVTLFVIIIFIVRELALFLFGTLGAIGGLFLVLFIAKYYFDISWLKAFFLFLIGFMVVIVLGMLGGFIIGLAGVALSLIG